MFLGKEASLTPGGVQHRAGMSLSSSGKCGRMGDETVAGVSGIPLIGQIGHWMHASAL